jgi:formate dehydrogenase major subunit
MNGTINVTIDGIKIEARERDTVLIAARSAGIDIPTMCYLEGRRSPETCGVCMVEVEGYDVFMPACALRVSEGMVVRTDTEAVRKVRRAALELLLSDHLGDCEALCERACPAHIDIPRFVRLQADGKHAAAIAVIKERMAFPGILGRICPMFCERACRRKDIDEPVSICALKRFAADWDMASDQPHQPEKKPDSGKKVAIIGAGIAGLTAAYHLLQEGHACTIFDSRKRPGGLLRHVIPGFRLPQAVVDFEIDRISELGLQYILGKSVGKDVSFEDLRRDFDAVLVATGAALEIRPPIAGIEDAASAASFLEEIKDGGSLSEVKSAVIVGSGPADLDLARALIRLNVQRVVYLPGKRVSGGADAGNQLDIACVEGVMVREECIVQRIERLKTGTYRVDVESGGKEESIEAERVFFAGEMSEDESFLDRLGIHKTITGERVDRQTMATNMTGVFAAGSVVRPRIHAVQASAMGSLAARSISRYLRGEPMADKHTVHVVMSDLSEQESARMLEDASPKSRYAARHSESLEMNFEANQGFDEDTATREAKRCLQCACAAKDDCLLRDLSSEYDADPRFYRGVRKTFERDSSHPDIIYESSKCIRCGKCILIAEEAHESLGLTVLGRGFKVRVGVPFNETIKAGLREVAIRCAEVCPTGALSVRRESE